MSIGERIKEVRETTGQNQRQFAASIKIGQSTLAMFEGGHREPKNIHIEQICSKYGVNEEWLKTGNGKMLKSLTKNQEIGAFLNDVMQLDDKKFKRRFIETLSRFDEKDWSNLEIIINKFLQED